MFQETSTPPEAGTSTETTSHWLEELPEDAVWPAGRDGREDVPLRDHPRLRQFRTPADLARSWLEAQRLVGRKTVGLTPLPDDAPDRDKAEFERELRRMTGVPEAPDGYEIELPENAQADKEMMDWYRHAAHDLGLSPRQAQGLAQAYHGLARDLAQRQEQARELDTEQARKRAAEEVQRLWGHEAPARTDQAKRAFTAAASLAGLDQDQVRSFLAGHGDDPLVLRLFAAVGDAFREDGLVEGPGRPAAKSMSMEQFYADEVFGGR